MYNVLSEKIWYPLYSTLFRNGGIIPPVARDLHKEHIEDAVTTALSLAGIGIKVNTARQSWMLSR